MVTEYDFESNIDEGMPMMNGKNIVRMLVLMVVLIATAGLASAISLTVDKVEVNDVEVSPNQVTRLDQVRDNEFEVRVKFTAQDNLKNAELVAFMSGYEYNDFDRIASNTHVFDADANVTYTKILRLKLSDMVEEDDYKLRLIFTDRNGQELIQNYNLKIDVPRHVVKIEDVMMSPASEVRSGSALLTTVRVRNLGEKLEKDLKVTVSIPELGLEAADYVDELKTEQEKETEEIYLRIPKCAKEGSYQARIWVDYDRNHEKAATTATVNVVGDDSCKPLPQPVQTVQVVVPAQPAAPAAAPAKSGLRGAMEVMLLVLVALLVVIALIIGFSRMKGDEE
ncbi:hypothetical protein HY642_05765 [Candidatus Woesearchaeota archaeon]|nr:hypothetical protein [Candidatus Woesearchaeota archaeon]